MTKLLIITDRKKLPPMRNLVIRAMAKSNGFKLIFLLQAKPITINHIKLVKSAKLLTKQQGIASRPVQSLKFYLLVQLVNIAVLSQIAVDL